MKINRAWFRKEVAPILLALVLVTAARSSLADHYYVPSGSMEYSLMPGDRVVVDKTAYGWRIPYTKFDVIAGHAPQRGEIALFDSPDDGKMLIKRIVAVGDDVVALQDGHLFINGVALARGDGGDLEQFGDRIATLNLRDGGGPSFSRLRVPSGKVLAIGDHRGNSQDGRFFGFIDERELYGRAVAVYYRSEDGFVWKKL